MNQDIFQGQWNRLKGTLKQQWGKLTDNDVALIKAAKETNLLASSKSGMAGIADHKQESNTYFSKYPVS